MGKKKGRQARKAKHDPGNQEQEEIVKAPHSFVIYRGQLGKNVGELMRNFRKVMEPYTASHMKVQKRNAVKDFVAVSGMLNVTHLVVFTKSQQAIYMRLARLPRGPTLTFRVQEYTLVRDVLSSLRKRITFASQFAHHPLLVLNNFSGNGIHFKLMTSMFQNMFPSINVNKVNLNNIRRCVLLNYDSETNTIDFRHYTTKVVPCGIGKSIKKIVQAKIPDLSRFDDISEFILQPGYLSESEAEQDGPFNQVTLPQPISSRGNNISQQSAIRLIELGPRMKLELLKIEEGLMEGQVLYHSLIQKTPEEVKNIARRREEQKLLKVQRKQKQEENQRRKVKFENEDGEEPEETKKRDESDNEAIDDMAWYEKEVGKKPDDDMFPSNKKHKFDTNDKGSRKKIRIEDRKERNFISKDGSRTSEKSKKFKKGSQTEKSGINSATRIVGFEELMKRRKKRKEAKLKRKTALQKSRKVSSHIRELRVNERKK